MRFTEGLFSAAVRALTAPAMVGVTTLWGSPTSKAITEATWATPETSSQGVVLVSGFREPQL